MSDRCDAGSPSRSCRSCTRATSRSTLAAAAALVLDAEPAGLPEAGRRAARPTAATRGRRGPALAAAARRLCAEAAREHRGDCSAGDATEARSRAVPRASHRRLRREVWGVIPANTCPCCAAGHGHASDRSSRWPTIRSGSSSTRASSSSRRASCTYGDWNDGHDGRALLLRGAQGRRARRGRRHGLQPRRARRGAGAVVRRQRLAAGRGRAEADRRSIPPRSTP